MKIKLFLVQKCKKLVKIYFTFTPRSVFFGIRADKTNKRRVATKKHVRKLLTCTHFSAELVSSIFLVLNVLVRYRRLPLYRRNSLRLAQGELLVRIRKAWASIIKAWMARAVKPIKNRHEKTENYLHMNLPFAGNA